MIRPVVLLPGAVLRHPAPAVEAFGEATEALAADLLDTMDASEHCVGLAAPQIGVSLRAFSLDVRGHPKTRCCHGRFVLFNPEVVASSRNEIAREGCMSVPDLTGDVRRATRLTVRGRTATGEPMEVVTDAFEARAIQHEIDHLDGLLFLDRVVATDRVFPRKVYR